MEDGDISHTGVLSTLSADDRTVLPDMANYPDLEVTVIKSKNPTDAGTKVNGESDNKDADEDDEDSTDEDALVIDEERKNQKKTTRKRLLSPSTRTDFKGFKKRMLRKSTEVLKIVNEYINAAQLGENESEDKCDNVDDSNSQGELDNIVLQEAITKNMIDDTEFPKREDNETPNLILNPVDEENTQNKPLDPKPNVTINKIKSTAKNKKNPSPKLTEYAQYLGLQPTVKFKCYKCSESSFPSMSALNEHQQQCLVQAPSSKPNPSPTPSPTTPSTNFRVTRKVYLCSACGTYYENWNLFLHMREVHRRFICLYCLGMFSLVEKLSQHLVAKHNCVPSHYLSAEEYLSTCKEACFLMCCHCERVFTEQDNFFDHICTEKAMTSSDKACWSCGAKGTNPHLPSCKASIEQPSTSNQKPNKTLKSNPKQIKSTKKTPFANVEHVTADSPSKPLSPRLEPEQTCDIANLCTVDMEPATIKSEPVSPEMSPRERSPSFSEEPKEDTDPEPTEDPEISNNENTEDKDVEEEKPNTPENDEPIENESENDQECPKTESDIENNTQSEPHSPEVEENIPNDSPPQNCYESDKDADSDINMETKNNETNETDSVKETEDQNSVDLAMNTNNDSDRNAVSEPEMDIDNNSTENTEEIRRVPKVTLKLPPRTRYSDHESEDSEKLTMEVEENEESEQEYDESQENCSKENDDEKPVNGFEENDRESPNEDRYESEGFPVAGEDVSVVELELEQPLDKFTTENLLKTCLGATISTCIYCNHARKIAVNGKQLGLHAIAEHRFSATVNSITAEELIPHNFVVRIKDGLSEVEDAYFNLEMKVEDEKEEQQSDINFKREYECFQCRYVTAIHKELYLHNRKMHAKTILLCIICKSNFYSYSELICHLCPGNYVLNNDMKFRCCMCDIGDLPSAFRLMVHLRKRHHTCDVCLEGCTNQSRLSNHVWKHKLHHLCYRCGIAYRNKPDITRHLFWKHGTESVLCKKCLQKKWPHIYHFCIPPTAFVCEDCNLSFSRAVYLKVHKRLHSNDKKHYCTEENCSESFISKKLVLKHIKRHQEPDPVPEKPVELMNGDLTSENDSNKPESLNKEVNENKEDPEELKEEKEEQKPKNIIDVYDLPALNLSESDSDDSEEDIPKPAVPASEEEIQKEESASPTEAPSTEPVPSETSTEPVEDEQKPVPIVDGIWDNFKHYQATIEKRDVLGVENKDTLAEESKDDLEKKEIEKIEVENLEKTENEEKEAEKPKVEDEIEEVIIPDIDVIMGDHDYCIVSSQIKETEDDKGDKKDESEMDHDYCTVTKAEDANQNINSSEGKHGEVDKKKNKSKKKNSSSSDSSSDSDSSSCTCGSNCSCSSSSGSSSSSSSSSDSESSSSEGKRRIAARRERRKERAKRKKESETSHAASNNSAVDVMATEETPLPPIIELPIEESDLDTDETETDEDFYDEHPQRLANKVLEEKRNLLTGATPPISNGSIIECSRPSTPSIPEEMPPKKKVKSKKRKKKSRSSTPKQEIHNIPTYNHQQSPLAIQQPITPIQSLVHRPTIPSPILHHPVQVPPVVPRHIETPKPSQTTGSGSETDSNVRSSKRRRVPNKFYGYSSDDESAEKPPAPPILKWRKADLPSTPTIHVTASPKFVPPITIKNIPSPAPIVEPIQAPVVHHTEVQDSDSEADEVPPRKSSSESSDSNRNEDSDSDGQLHISQPQFPSIPVPQVQRTNENLYCYCQCPYDEVSEMIACDGRECAIEWFHFECVGIMVPPKGKWFCPDCRKKTNLRNDFIQT